METSYMKNRQRSIFDRPAGRSAGIVVFTCLSAVAALATAAEQPSGRSVATFKLARGEEVTIREEPFRPENFKVEGCTREALVCLVNGRRPMGGTPQTVIVEIVVRFEGRSYSLDVSDMFNALARESLEAKHFTPFFGGVCYDQQTCDFRARFSDGAEGYVVEWLVRNGIATRTVLTDSIDIRADFKVEPPQFD